MQRATRPESDDIEYETVYDDDFIQTIGSSGVGRPVTEDDSLSAEKQQDAMRHLTNSKPVSDTIRFEDANAAIQHHPYHPGGLNPFIRANQPLANVGPTEWTSIEIIVDSGACETVMPRNLCQLIPIVPSAQSLAKIEYEVASGKNIPNLGERHCEVYADGCEHPLLMHFQVADVH